MGQSQDSKTDQQGPDHKGPQCLLTEAEIDLADTAEPLRIFKQGSEWLQLLLAWRPSYFEGVRDWRQVREELG